MKSASQIARVLCGVAVCLLALAPRARAVENPIAMTEKLAKPAIVIALEKATEGLQMMSETDAPFIVVFFESKTGEAVKTECAQTEGAETEGAETEGAETKKTDESAVLNAQKLAGLAGAPNDAKIETRDLKEFFAASATVEDWMNDDEKATVARFAVLLETLQTQLKNVQVLVWGDAEKRVAILGECEGGLAGLTTLIVET